YKPLPKSGKTPMHVQTEMVLIVEALPPWWSETCAVLCEALDNVLSLACSLDGPCRIPLLSLYAISRQQECLLPFVQVRGNLARLRSCVEELRSIPGDGCIRGPARGGELLRQAVLDSLQQFKQYTRHTSTGSQAIYVYLLCFWHLATTSQWELGLRVLMMSSSVRHFGCFKDQSCDSLVTG
uniref:Meiosis 1 associated protein n=1 Tax=Myripristis murdjan TaxID=586833 RepID=A0A668A2W3_9TELE